MIEELSIGKTTAWDVNYVAFDYYDDYLPHQKKFDMLGMAKHGVLRIPPEIIDPVNRQIIALQTNMQVLAYNKKLIPRKYPPTASRTCSNRNSREKNSPRIFDQELSPRLCRPGDWRKCSFMPKGWPPNTPSWTRGDTRTLPLMTGGEIPMSLRVELQRLPGI